MKKVLSAILCLNFLSAPLQALAVSADTPVVTETPLTVEQPTPSEPELAPEKVETKEPSLPEVDEETPTPPVDSFEKETVVPTPAVPVEPPLVETPSSENQAFLDKVTELKHSLFNPQHTRSVVMEKAEGLLASKSIITMTELIDEMIYLLAGLFDLEYEDIVITEEERLELAREILTEYCHYSDYLIATHKEIYTAESLASLKAIVVAARQLQNSNEATFDSMEDFFIKLQEQVNLLEKKVDFVLDTTALTDLLAEIAAAKLVKKTYVLQFYEIFENYRNTANELLELIEKGEVFPQQEVDTITSQLRLAYTSLVKKDPSTINPREVINLNITDTNDNYPILTETSGGNVTFRLYGDNGLFQEEDLSRLVIYVDGHQIFEDYAYTNEPLDFSKNELNRFILEAKLDALEAGVTVPDISLVTRDYAVTISDSRKIPTEVVIIPEQESYLDSFSLTGGNFGETYLVYTYDADDEFIEVDYYLVSPGSTPNEGELPLESTVLELGEAVNVSVLKDGTEKLVRLVFEKEAGTDKPEPPKVKPPKEKPKNKKEPKDTNTTKPKTDNKNQKKNLPKTNELTESQFLLQLLGSFMLALVFYRLVKRNQTTISSDS